MEVLIVKPGNIPYEKEIENTLSAMQEIVSGYIQAIYTGEGDVIVLNEEGKILGLQPNRSFGSDIFAGTFFIAGVDGDEFTSLSDERIAYYTDMFREPTFETDNEIEDCSWEYEL